ncbi:MAG: Uma2 family endonuclease, partial [Cyanobacteria bacterium Co-bin8]|nr:Uma2 family endonuclease [Cyanobacteria bacterium Co-bin8]
LEIDITSKSLDRFPIYARLGVPELWYYDSGALKIYHLQNTDYVLAKRSLVFPLLAVQTLPQLIESHRSSGRRAVRQAIRRWVREQLGQQE